MDKDKRLAEYAKLKAARMASRPAVRKKPERNPLDALKPSGNIETDDKAETDTVVSRIEAKSREVAEVMGNGYWFAMVFVTREQCDEFLRKTGWDTAPNQDDIFFDGVEIAKRLGIDLTPTPIPFRERQTDNRAVKECGLIEQPKH